RWGIQATLERALAERFPAASGEPSATTESPPAALDADADAGNDWTASWIPDIEPDPRSPDVADDPVECLNERSDRQKEVYPWKSHPATPMWCALPSGPGQCVPLSLTQVTSGVRLCSVRAAAASSSCSRLRATSISA